MLDEDKTMYNVVFKKLLDMGDFIGIEGELFVTQVGEQSILVQKLHVLSKAIRPLPAVATHRFCWASKQRALITRSPFE